MNKSSRRSGWVHVRKGFRINRLLSFHALRQPDGTWLACTDEMIKRGSPGICDLSFKGAMIALMVAMALAEDFRRQINQPALLPQILVRSS
jgi:hypothetical protein